MFTVTALLAPFMVCATWAVTIGLQADKNDALKHMAWLLIAAAVYFFIDASYVMPGGTHEDYVNLVFLDIVSQFITVSLFPIIIMFLSVLATRKRPKLWKTILCLLPGIFLGTAATVIYFSMGIQNAADFIAATDIANGRPAGYEATIYLLQEIFCQKIYNIVLLIEIIVVFFYAIRLMVQNGIKFSKLSGFRKGTQTLNPVNSVSFLILVMLGICAIRIMLGRHYLLDHLFVSGMLSVLLGAVCFVIAFISNWFSDRNFNLWDLQHPAMMRTEVPMAVLEDESVPVEKPEYVPDPALQEIPVPLAPPTSLKEEKALNRLEQFLNYMTVDRPFLNPDLSIMDVAEALHSNRTYISILVNENFQMTFRDYINKRRIEFSKEVMLEHPDEILEAIAEASGFLSDSQFSKKFKEVEGVSPRTWLQKQLMK